MDEPTAALGVEQQAAVGELMQAVAAKGIAVLLISHNLPQVHAICDRIVVLFHGRTVTDLRPSQASVDEIVRWITGVAIATGGR
jgi:simple sugar transport system ATP-binding protein